jgi:hypothetical protein
MPYFDRVKRFCFFIAESEGGLSILSRLLSTHPDVLISDKLNSLQYFREGYSADQVYALIKMRACRVQRRQRSKTSGEGLRSVKSKEKHPIAIGDSAGVASANLLASDHELLQQVRAAVGVPLRVIIYKRDKARRLNKRSNEVGTVAAQLNDDERLFQTHNELIADPRGQFERLFRFLDVEPSPVIVEACTNSILTPTHKRGKLSIWKTHRNRKGRRNHGKA